MEGSSSRGRQKRGGNDLKKPNWKGSDYMNDDNVNKYCQEKLYPYDKFLPAGQNKYSEDNSKTSCYNVIGLVVITGNKQEEWNWYDKVVPIKNKKFINMRNNNRGSC